MNIVEFFDEIHAMSKERRDIRIKVAKRLEIELVEFFNIIFLDIKSMKFLYSVTREEYREILYDRLYLVYMLLLEDDEPVLKQDHPISSQNFEIKAHIRKAAQNIVDTTIDGFLAPESDTEFGRARDTMTPVETTDVPDSIISLLSRERAQMIAANESLFMNNYKEDETAKAEGKKYKVWNTMEDERVRPTHVLANKSKVPIGQPFIVGTSMLMFPGDTSLGADPSEIILCRCFLTYQ